MSIRLAREDEVDRIREIEELAGAMYGEAGLPTDLPGMTPEEVRGPIRAGTLFVATDDTDRAIAFALCWLRPDAIHLRELDVDPAFMRRRIGRGLVEHVCGQARARGLSAVTLTTFRDVAWNAPYYERCGFVRLDDASLPGWLADVRAEERASGLDRWPRVAMRRAV